MNFYFTPYSKKEETLWDGWCKNSRNATFLHSQKFLQYHGQRFKDCSILIYEEGRLVGLFPAAEDPQNLKRLISHPGITYGGIVHQGWLVGERMVRLLEQLKIYYRDQGYTHLIYKVIPYAYALISSQDDLYALYRLEAKRVRCDLSSIIDLNKKRIPSKRRLRSLKKANKEVVVQTGSEFLEPWWLVLKENLNREHQTNPVHSLEEMKKLIAAFPKEIQLYVAYIDGIIEAGVLLFNSPQVWHAQYIASSVRGYAASALDAVFEQAIHNAAYNGISYFDFGTSNEENGKILNEGLYQFKSGFGGGGMVHEYYEIEL